MTGSDNLVLITGASGYVGGRLCRVLEAAGQPLRCMARRPEYLRPKVASSTDVVAGDVLDPSSLVGVLRGVHTAYYLIHSMAASRDYAERDHRGAVHFAQAAKHAGVRHIIYLGGLGDGRRLSRHLASRQEVGRVLRESGIPTIEFRASIVIGSGSLSFELVRALVEKLPAMVTPTWVDTLTQPIGIEDLIAYLAAALERPTGESVVYEIGGPDRVSYGDLMREYGRLRGLTRLMLRVPLLTPRLSSLWLALISPVYARVGRELIGGLRTLPWSATAAPSGTSASALAGCGRCWRGRWRTKTRASPQPAGPTRSALNARRGAGVASSSAPAGWILARCACSVLRERHSGPSRRSAVRPDGTTAITCGACEA